MASTKKRSIPEQFGIDRELHRDLIVSIAKRHLVSVELDVVRMDAKDPIPAHHVVEGVFQTADSRDAVVGLRVLGQQRFGDHARVLAMVLEEGFARGRKGFHG